VELAAGEVLIKAPMVGTFYAAPKPGEPDFVSVGDAVAPDTVLCIVEVMKLMNNIEAGVAGTVARVLVRNEQAVQYGQPLMVIRRNA
jgi:acetyl-CoA carboxylase biotin carboxyl carrier protein